jgi:hypothetical protein
VIPSVVSNNDKIRDLPVRNSEKRHIKAQTSDALRYSDCLSFSGS